MKKVVLPLVVIFTCLIGYIIIYNEEYAIPDSTLEVETAINEYNQIKSPRLVPVKVDKLMQIEDSNIWISTLTFPNNRHGYVTLKKGWNNRYRLTGWGTRPSLTSFELETNKGLFVVVIGQNEDLSINNVSVTINGMGKDYEYDISNEQKFIKLIKIPNEYRNRIWTTFKKFDENNNEL